MEENQELTQDQIVDELSAGYNDEDAEEVAVEVEEPQEEETVDPGPDPVQEELKELRRKLDNFEKLEQRLRKSEGHIGDLIKKTAAKRDPTPEELEQRRKDEEDEESVRELHGPELLEYLNKRDLKLADRLAKPDEIARIRAELETDFRKELTNVQQSFESRLVSAVHPGWSEEVKTDDFKTWFTKQPDEFKKLAESPRADDANKLMNAYKRKPSTDKDERLARSVAPKKTSSPSKPLTTANMTPEQRRAYEIKAGYDDD